MNSSAVEENARSLAAALGVAEHEAASLLDVAVIVTALPAEAASTQLADFLKLLLSRTVKTVAMTLDINVTPVVEVIVGGATPVTASNHVWVGISPERITVGSTQEESQTASDIHPVFLLLSACYAAASVVRTLVGESLPVAFSDPVVITFNDILGDNFPLHESFDLGTAYLAGAGAIGNGFLLALSVLNVGGELHVVDPDTVSAGNLNRCVWFSETDIGSNKAERIAEIAQPKFAHLRLVPHAVMLQQLPAARGGGAWLEKLIVGVDSRRARRSLQSEIPREIYDASTTDIREVVLHFSHQLGGGLACLSCIYAQESVELAHESHVADSLGVSLEDVRSNFVSNNTAHKIHARYPHLPLAEIEGKAYDSLFKQLCGEGVLHTEGGRQVLAPFSFVSVLAGTYLAIELVRRLHNNDTVMPFNYWRASPWASPNIRLRSLRQTNSKCEFCSNKILRDVAKKMWDR